MITYSHNMKGCGGGLLYSLDIQAQPEPVGSPVTIKLLPRKVRGLVLPCPHGRLQTIFTPGIIWCGSQDLNVKNGQDRILALLNFQIQEQWLKLWVAEIELREFYIPY
jgi:hypothetical protein